MTHHAHDKYDPNCPHERTHRDAGGAEICTDCRNIVLKPTHDDKPTDHLFVGERVIHERSGEPGIVTDTRPDEQGYCWYVQLDNRPDRSDWYKRSVLRRIPVNPHDDTTPINGSYKHIPGAEELSQEWMKEGMDDTTEPMTVEQILRTKIGIGYAGKPPHNQDSPKKIKGIDEAIAAINALIEQRVISELEPFEKYRIPGLTERIAKLKEGKKGS